MLLRSHDRGDPMHRGCGQAGRAALTPLARPARIQKGFRATRNRVVRDMQPPDNGDRANTMNAQAWAAWAGFGLSLLNLAIGLWGRRPLFTLRPDINSSDHQAVIVKVSAGVTPVLVRSVRVLPFHEKISVTDSDTKDTDYYARLTHWIERRSFIKLINPGETGGIRFSGFPDRKTRLVVITWADQRFQPLPWKVFVLTSRRLEEYARAADGMVGLD